MSAYRFDADVWLHDGEGAWHFVTLPADVSDDIDAQAPRGRPGFGSVRVRVTIGATTWETSVFPDKKRGAYVLPVRKDVRTREGLSAGDRTTIALDVIE